MDKKQCLKRIEELDTLIKQHSYLYHVLDTPTIGDLQYDELIRKRDKLIADNPDLDYSGLSVTPVPIVLDGSNLKPVKHDFPMLSLENAFNETDLNKFYSRFPEGTEYIYEHKLDGLALSFIYENGKLVKLLTRGDGLTGEDVSHQIKLFVNVPDTIPTLEKVHVRGEGLLTQEQFVALKEITNKNYKTNRNSIAGLVRSLKLGDEFIGLASFVPYGLIGASYDGNSYSDNLKVLESWGFTKPEPASNYNVLNNLRSNIYPTDGIVIKVNDRKLMESAGGTNHHPKWAVAYKFPDVAESTKLEDVIWETGRLGNVTPVAVFKPVNLNNVTVTRATLHNYKRFMEYKPKVGSIITVCRSGDVVPFVLSIDSNGKGKNIHPPKLCPSCQEPLSFDGANDEDIFIFCSNNFNCPAQIAGRFINFVGKSGLDIKGLGTVIMTKLVDFHYVKDLKDVFLLPNKRDEIPKDIIGEKTFINICKAIDVAKNVEASDLVCSLGIPGVGEGISKVIANSVNNVEELITLLKSQERLTKLEMIDGIISMGIVNAINAQNGLLERELRELIPFLNISFNNKTGVLPQVVVSGLFSIPRKTIANILKEHNLELSSKVNSKTIAFIKGDKAKTHKVDSAIAKGIRVIDTSDLSTEKQFVKMIKGI